jgi:hypothetical protein
MPSKVIYTQNACCNAVVRTLDDGTNHLNGRLCFYTDASVLLTALPLSYPAFRDATDGTCMANFIYDATSFVDGTASWFTFENRDSQIRWMGTVSDILGSGDIRFTNPAMPKDSTVSIQSYAYFVPA